MVMCMVKQDTINLPDDIEIMGYIGQGGRAKVHSAMYGSEEVIVKVYDNDVIRKYKESYNVDIAVYEHTRNTLLYSLPEIKKYIAKPCKVYSASSEYTQCVIQERVYGESLYEVINKLGYLPVEILDAGRSIVRIAEKNGIHDLDISVGNVMIKKIEKKWVPTLYDFNIMPQYLFPPNIIVGLGYKLGIRKKSFRDYRSLRNWERRGKQKKWVGRN